MNYLGAVIVPAKYTNEEAFDYVNSVLNKYSSDYDENESKFDIYAIGGRWFNNQFNVPMAIDIQDDKKETIVDTIQKMFGKADNFRSVLQMEHQPINDYRWTIAEVLTNTRQYNWVLTLKAVITDSEWIELGTDTKSYISKLSNAFSNNFDESVVLIHFHF